MLTFTAIKKELLSTPLRKAQTLLQMQQLDLYFTQRKFELFVKTYAPGRSEH